VDVLVAVEGADGDPRIEESADLQGRLPRDVALWTLVIFLFIYGGGMWEEY
jgi:hypothetical protein